MAHDSTMMKDAELASAVMLALGGAALQLTDQELQDVLICMQKEGLPSGLLVNGLCLLRARGRDIRAMADAAVKHSIEVLERNCGPLPAKK